MGKIILPPMLVESIRRQNAVLFMGAGASYGAKHPENYKMPLANDLRDQICDHFLGGNLKDRNLAEVADYAANESSLPFLQDFIKQIFQDFGPADFHMLVPSFRWKALISTNYDLIIEKAYSNFTEIKQQLVTFYKNGQQVDTELKKHVNGIQFLKIHGCINYISDREVPLILCTDQYVRYKINRERLYNRVQDFGYEHPIIFCGYKISDLHIKEVIFDLADDSILRPQYYYVAPDVSDYEIRYWARHRIMVIQATFKDFLEELDKQISKNDRKIASAKSIEQKTTIQSRYRVRDPDESFELIQFLKLDVDHIRLDMPVENQNPKEFYKGYDTGWGGIAKNLDVRRSICDTILVDAILQDEKDRRDNVDLFLIKGPAGSGKTIVLKRVAWEAANEFNKLVFFLKGDVVNRLEIFEEIYRLTGERIFLFVDRAALISDEIRSLIEFSERNGVKLSIIASERENEWNIRCEDLEPNVSKDFPVRPLNNKEAEGLLILLEQYDALGELSRLSKEKRLEALLNRAERQLLVVLHEATFGKPFEQIVLDEYHGILPGEAQNLYLDVCTLNRLGIKVRAGLIARISGVRFEDFQNRFFRPLEHVVKTSFDPYIQDRTYSARHQHIAEMVFEQIFVRPEERYDQLVRIISGINNDYSSDFEAFKQIIKGQNIINEFKSHELGRAFYEAIEGIHGRTPHLLQQKSIFEMRHQGGSIHQAEKYIDEALSLAPNDSGIKHTKAMVARCLAQEVDNQLLKDKYRKQAKTILGEITSYRGGDPYGYYAKALIAFDELKDTVNKYAGTEDDKLAQRQLAEATKAVQSILGEALQKFPDKSELLNLESQFRDFLSQHDRAIDALWKAFNSNKRQDWLAIRLARKLSDAGKIDEAKLVLTECLEANPSSKTAHFEIAKIYRDVGNDDERKIILDHFRRSFTEGDQNIEAKFWYARQLFIEGDYTQSNIIFEKLKKEKISPDSKNKQKGPILDDGNAVKDFTGRVKIREATYLFITSDNHRFDIFSYTGDLSDDISRKFELNSKVKFNIAFNMKGPIAINVRKISGME